MYTFLILINAANKMGRNHAALGDHLKKKGYNVIYALVDHFPFYTENIDRIKKERYYVFADYFSSHYNQRQIDPRYAEIDLNKLYFSDYDRVTIHKRHKEIRGNHYDSLMCNLINFFDHIFTENKIEMILYESISNSFAYAAFEVGKIHNAQYCGYAGSRLKNRFELYVEEFGCMNSFSRVYEEYKEKDVPQNELNAILLYLENYKVLQNVPTYHPQDKIFKWNISLINRYFGNEKINQVIAAIKYLIKHKNEIPYSYQLRNPLVTLWKGFQNQFKRRIRTKSTRKFFLSPDYKDKYFLYPLHFKPEASTSVLAPYYCNDVAVIENIAFSLPPHHYLYVKEHFVNYGLQPNTFYKSLLKIPNVKLIFCDENIKDLIRFSQGIITLTSTVGFEALMMKKPVFTLGNVFYTIHPNCRKITNFPELRTALKNLEINESSDVNIKFLYAYSKVTFTGNLYYGLGSNYNTEDFILPFTEAIEKVKNDQYKVVQ